jgi:uncharacterized protein (UPF0276 family)
MLGAGLCYQKELHDFVVEHAALIDYLEIVPDTAWTDHGQAAVPRYVDDGETLAFFHDWRSCKPIVAHSIGLSIGSAHRFRNEHLAQIRRWDERLHFAWHSDHLAFNLVLDARGEEYLLGVPFPVTLDEETLELLVVRIERIQDAIDKPFLLENNVSYIHYVEQDYDEPTFLNALCRRSGCGLLLDLHNAYVNWRNGGIEVSEYVQALDLERVVEIHLAGGLVYGGAYLDAHSGPVPDELWAVAADAARACRNLRGITFELLGSWYRHMGSDALIETLTRMRTLAASYGAKDRAA